MQDNAFSFDLDDFDDLMAIPEDAENKVLGAISSRLEVADIHNWLDLYFTGADALRAIDPDVPTTVAHNIIVPLVSKAIEDAI